MPVTEKNKEQMFSVVRGFEIKESESGDLVRGGYIATTHLDSGFYDSSKGKWVRDKISKETLDVWAKEINDGNPRSNKVSINHNREPHVAGVGLKGTARVDFLKDGEYGLYVDTLIDKTKDNFKDTKYRVEKGLLDSFSIEFSTKNLNTGDYLPGAAKEEEFGDGIIRTLLPGTILEGWTLASQPMNEHAVMIKEIVKGNEQSVEVKTMSEEEIKKPVEQIPEVEEVKKEEVVQEKEAPSISAEDLALLKEAKERQKMEAKEAEYKKIIEQVKEELKESLKDFKVESKVMKTPAIEVKPEVKEYMSMINSKEFGVDAKFRIAGKTCDAMNLTVGGITKTSSAESRQYKNFMINNNKLEMKGLGITTNQNTDTDYLLSSAELSDVFDPVIYNYLNQKTTTWNMLAKDDYSNKGNNLVQFTIKTGKNGSAGAYTVNAISLDNVSRLKLQTKFKKYAVGVEVDGDMIAAARGGPIGDVFAQEVMDSTDDLMEVMNQALYAEVGLETAAGIIGFEYICDSAGNTTLYNLTRSAANQLSPDSATDTYINGAGADITVDNLRKAIRQSIEEGASLNNLVFFCSPIQYDKIKSLYDDAQRLVPTSSRYGFTGLMEFDGIPVFFDKDCSDDDIFLVDLETHRVGMWVPPTLEMLGKDSDSQKGFIKTYFCTYNRAPRRMVMIYGNATS